MILFTRQLYTTTPEPVASRRSPRFTLIYSVCLFSFKSCSAILLKVTLDSLSTFSLSIRVRVSPVTFCRRLSINFLKRRTGRCCRRAAAIFFSLEPLRCALKEGARAQRSDGLYKKKLFNFSKSYSAGLAVQKILHILYIY